MINYKIDILSYTGNNSVRSDCGDITFFCVGLSTVKINNTVELNQNESLTITANENEIDRTIYNFSFDQNVTDQRLTVFRKVYI